MKKTIVIALAAFSSICAAAVDTPYLGTDFSGATYTKKEMQREQQVVVAQVINIRQIKIQDDPSVAQSTSGAGLGALAVLGFAGTSGNPYGLAAGVISAALAGGAVSNQVANKFYSTQGYEFTVYLKDGRIASFSQSNVDDISVGDKVFITRDSDSNFKVYKVPQIPQGK